MTLDLVPGAWRHGLQPALKVHLRSTPAELGDGDRTAAERAWPAMPTSGLDAASTQARSSMPLAERYYRNSEVDVQAEPLVHGPLILPEQVYLSKVAGTIRARVYIDEQGTVVSVDIVHAHPVRGVFEEAALEALSQVRYRPAILAGQAVKSQKLIEVKFDPYVEPHAPTP